MGLSIKTTRFWFFATMFVFTQCAAQRNGLRFGIQFNNFESQSQKAWDFHGLDSCRILEPILVFSDHFEWYLDGTALPLPESVKSAFVSTELIDFWDGTKQGISRIGFRDGDSLSCIGMLRLSNKFESYLLRHSSESQWTKVVRIYLVNVKSNELLSIIGLSQYAIGSGFRLRIYTLAKGGNRFVQESVSCASDIIDLEQEDKEIGNGQRFLIDDNGRIKVL